MDEFASAAMAEMKVRRKGRRRAVGVTATIWASVNGFITMVWALTGADGTWWFMFPAGATAIPLAIHAAAAFLSTDPELEQLQERERQRQLAAGDDW